MEGTKFSSLYCYIKSKKEYIQVNKMPDVSCLCPDYENIELLCAGIKHACPEANLLSNCNELMDLIACKPITPACVDGSCQNCPTIDLECIKNCDSIMFYKWAKGSKYYEKSLFTLSGIEASDLLEKQITYLRAHYYLKRAQSKVYTRQVHELSEGEMVVHVDFSKNYKNKQKNEIKAAYYGQSTFSLYTVVLYIKDSGVVKSRSVALVREENDHSFNISYDHSLNSS